jgi:hypothetical protein
LFSTHESLNDSDTDSGRDLYLRTRGVTSLVSVGSAVGNGGPDAFYKGESRDGAAVFLETDESLSGSDTDSFQDVYVASDRAYAFPVGASPMRLPMIPAFQPCANGGANAMHKAPFSAASCSPPVPASGLVAVGPKSLSFARFRVLGTGQCAPFNPSACYPDFTLTISATDVRSGSASGPDYDTSDPNGADLTFTATFPGAASGDGLQLTDRYNRPQSDAAAAYDKSATTSSLRFPVSVNCTATADTTVGSTCSAQTTANTLAPGAAVAGNRALWELGQIQMLDQGADGVPGNGDDSVFAVEGVFVP